MSHHVHVLVTCSNIHKSLLHCGIREKRVRKREGSEGEIRERGRDRDQRKRERGGGRESWHANTCHGAPQQKQVGYVDL